jgi:hypothetical protein
MRSAGVRGAVPTMMLAMPLALSAAELAALAQCPEYLLFGLLPANAQTTSGPERMLPTRYGLPLHRLQ